LFVLFLLVIILFVLFLLIIVLFVLFLQWPKEKGQTIQ
jgi:hypothetical protein